MDKHATKKCDALESALEVIGDKWTLPLIRSLRDQPLTFCNIEDALEGISPRTLSQRLDMLEAKKIISRKCYCEHPPRFKYELTKKGEGLQKVLDSMSRWGEKYAN